MSQQMLSALAVVCLVCLVHASVGMPPPFGRVLYLTNPPMTGNDVLILQNLIARSAAVTVKVATNRVFDNTTATAVNEFQKASGLPTGPFEAQTANLVLNELFDDGFRDDGTPARDYGPQFLYKIVASVHRNRSIETVATLFDRDNNILMNFPVRTHGFDDINPRPWPDFNNTGDGLNQFTSNGNTPTGLSAIDLNSPESEPRLYGPYPINRVVQGLKGNAGFLIPNLRDGILIHTGEWPNWTPGMPMPNSEGCIHSYPDSIKGIYNQLTAIGVQMRNNTNGRLPYPYTCQGILAVQYIGK